MKTIYTITIALLVFACSTQDIVPTPHYELSGQTVTGVKKWNELDSAVTLLSGMEKSETFYFYATNKSYTITTYNGGNYNDVDAYLYIVELDGNHNVLSTSYAFKIVNQDNRLSTLQYNVQNDNTKYIGFQVNIWGIITQGYVNAKIVSIR